MFIMPIIITILLYVVTKKMGWNDDILKTGVFICWLTALSLFACDMIGECIFGWWTTVINY